MKHLLCPQCSIRRFYVKDEKGKQCLVQVTTEYQIVPVNEGESLAGFNLDILYCLGCSWSGSPKSLKRY